MKIKGSLISLMLMAMICSGCGLSGEEIVPPKADDVLEALRQQDESVVQIQLKQCQRLVTQTRVGGVGNEQPFRFREPAGDRSQALQQLHRIGDLVLDEDRQAGPFIGGAEPQTGILPGRAGR